MPTIEYCLNNVSAATRNRLTELNCTVERRCLQRCGTCYDGDFLVVDGACKAGKPHADLLVETGVSER